MFTLDTRELARLDRSLAAAGTSFTPTLAGRALRKSLAPMLTAAKQYVPVGKRKVRSSLTRRTKNGGTKRDGTYDKGGATRRDLRIRIVQGKGNEVIRGLVGVSKSRGRVGWRTPFITRANKHRRTPNDFLARAERAAIDVVISQFGAEAQEVVRKVLSRI